MSEEPNNTYRCTAHEIIIKLMELKDADSLKLLRMHITKALAKIEPHPTVEVESHKHANPHHEE